jgi:hypothetical protein
MGGRDAPVKRGVGSKFATSDGAHTSHDNC